MPGAEAEPLVQCWVCHVIVSVPHDPVLGTPANYLKVTVWQGMHACNCFTTNSFAGISKQQVSLPRMRNVQVSIVFCVSFVVWLVWSCQPLLLY